MLWLQGSSESTYPIPTLYSSPYSYPRPHDLPYSGDRPTLDLRGGKDFLRGQVQPAYPRPLPLPSRNQPPPRPSLASLPYTAAQEADTERGIRPHENYQVRPGYPTPPMRHPYSAPSRGAQIGEIEAKDGLPSADRNNKATLLLTGPFRTAKSSAKDLTPLVLKLQYAKYHDALRAPWRNRLLRH